MQFWKNQHYCKKCSVKATKKYAKDNGIAKKRYHAIYEKVVKLKSNPCVDCHKKFPPCVMDFDHVRGKKLFQISHALSYTWSRVKKELRKCDLVCANCHRIRTHGEHK
jgi:hypothetical protein